MGRIIIPQELLTELNTLIDVQHSRIEDLQSKLDSALDVGQRLQQENIVLQSRNILLCNNLTLLADSLLHYFNKDQKRRERASVTVLRDDYGSHQHIGHRQGCQCIVCF